MKKMFLSAIVCAACLIGNAQNTRSTTTTRTSTAAASSSTDKFSLGPVAGVGWTTISNIDNSKFKLGGSFGLSAVYSAVEHFGIGLDVKYSFEGAKYDVANMNQNINLDYVRIPLKAIFFFNSYGSSVRPKIYVGPSFGFLNSAKVNSTDVKSSFESFDIGLLAGVGLNFRMVDRTWFNLDLGYTQGMKDITKNTVLSTEKNVNRNLTLNVGVNFGL